MAEDKKKKGFHLNLGIVVFAIILVYLAGYTVTYLLRPKLAVYQVAASNISDNIEATGVAIREEKVVNAAHSGYVNYYIKNGSRVSKNGVVYAVDKTGQVQKYLQNLMGKKQNIDGTEKQEIFSDLRSFSESYTDNNFSTVYSSMSDINNHLMAYTDQMLAEHKDDLSDKYSGSNYTTEESDVSGIVSYTSDGLELLKDGEVKAKTFQDTKMMKDLRTNGKVQKGSPVYRITTSQQWTLVVAVTDHEYQRLTALAKNKVKTVKVTFDEDDFQTTVPFQCQKIHGDPYVVLKFDNYVQRYLNQRFINVTLHLSDTRGLAVPASSVEYREAYKIPAKYLQKGGDEVNSQRVAVLGKKGRLTQKKITIYREKGNMAIISASSLNNGDVITTVDKERRYTIRNRIKVPGVYMVNRGYAIYIPIDILTRNEDYCIVKEEDETESKSQILELYDRIILNHKSVKENQIIY